ncbi:DUF3788 family protein [uncultured Bacteroides sp.]|uniref:DUF3788 family protein n=1 Tax=uncultured Bacteroides sp. TaxID=162156 RepID=UPI002635F284|nr:DUF3788 family protein [uncultured Bacteroides sp.]
MIVLFSVKLILTNKEEYPDDSVLERVLQQSYPMYRQMLQQLQAGGIEVAWNYYNDGKAWLGKLMWKKKNLGWLHVYSGMFRITIYFTEKYKPGVIGLDIPQNIKDGFLQASPSGKLIPLTLPIAQEQDLAVLLCLTEYKKKCR